MKSVIAGLLILFCVGFVFSEKAVGKLSVVSLIDKNSSAGELVSFLIRISEMQNHTGMHVKYTYGSKKTPVLKSLFDLSSRGKHPIVFMDISSFPLILSCKNTNITDLTYISLIARDPYVLVTRKDFSWKTLSQFVEAGRKVDNRVTIGVSENGVSGILGRSIEKLSGIKFLLVYIESLEGKVSSIMSGKIGTAILPLSWIYPRIYKLNRLRILAVVGDKRARVLPNIPSFRDVGIKGLPNGNVIFVVGSQGMSSTELGYVRNILKKAFKDSEWQSFCKSRGYEPIKPTNSGGFNYVRTEFEKVKRVLSPKTK